MDIPIETAAALYREMKKRRLHLRREYGRDDVLIAQIANRVGCNSPIDGYHPAVVADVWAKDYEKACVSIQVQTPYKLGRRTAIKPDLRVCFSDQYDDVNQTAAIVEYKQRIRLSQVEVAEVAKAYSGGSPNCGGVVILNYDSVPEGIKMPEGTSLIGEAHPCN